jgi:hypothetical protein
MPLQATSGAASYDAFGGGVPVVPNYIEEVFSSYLWTGTGATLSIVNNIDLATKGGLTWIKDRDVAYDNFLCDTERGALNELRSNTTQQQNSRSNSVTAFNSNGFSLGSYSTVNSSAEKYVAWTLRKQPKFFDIQTWSGSGSNRTISHNLGSVPACIMVKAYSGTTANSQSWAVYHRSLANTEYLVLNSTDAKATGATRWNSTTPTSTVFTVGTDSTVNASGNTYIAYIFAHDAGGFGLTGTDNVISCGSFTTDGSGNASVNLGYEPQWVLIKRTDGAQNWLLNDVMRGMSLGQTSSNVLFPNLSNAEYTAWSASPVLPNATGFVANGSGSGGFSASADFIYIAIRRGPMAVPTLGTSVFSAVSRTGTSANATVSASISPVDMVLETARDANFGTAPNAFDRLRGANRLLITSSTGAEVDTTSTPTLTGFDVQNGYTVGNDSGGYGINYSPYIFINWNFKRAPSFMDVVCYTGTGSAMTISHNLGTAPQLVILKERNAAGGWIVYSSPTGFSVGGNLAGTGAFSGGLAYVSATSSTTFTTITNATTWVAYLFATCAGVSKVGSYTGTGTTLQVDCGFTAGSRFVLIKRTDSTGDWYVWDSARGIVAGNDPYLLLNSSAAEVTNTDYVDTYNAGFEITSTSTA